MLGLRAICNMTFKLITLVTFFFCTNACFAYKIKTDDFNIKTDEFSVIQKEVQNVDKNTLVIFDIDQVLLEPKDQILKAPNGLDYDEISGRYSYIICSNITNQLSDNQLKNKIKKAIDYGMLTSDAYLYQYNTDNNTLRCLYINKNGKIDKKVMIMTANNDGDLAKIIGGLGLLTTKSDTFRRLTLNNIKIIESKVSVQKFEKFNEEDKITELKSKNEKKIILEKENTESMLMSQIQEVPVDDRMIDLVKHLQINGTKVLALTSMRTGRYWQIASMEAFRISRLKQSGYHFDKSWAGVKDQLLDQFLQNYPNKSVKSQKHEKKGIVFSKGVVLTNFSPKGNALMAFLRYTNTQPKKIIFIDDQRKNLKSVEDEARKNNIPFFGIEYTAAKDAKLEPINIKRAHFQLDTFKKTRKWCSDQEFRRLSFQKSLPLRKICVTEYDKATFFL